MLMAGDVSVDTLPKGDFQYGSYNQYLAQIPDLVTAQPSGISPLVARSIYGVDKIVLPNGAKGDGSGMTVAIIGTNEIPNVEDNLRVFSRAFGLPDPPSFRVVNQFGGTVLPPPDPTGAAAAELNMDVQWVHAIAPKANILLVLANSFDDIYTAIDYARHQPGVVAVSMSFGGPEFAGQTLVDPLFTTPAGHEGITFVASSGDDAIPGLPGSDSNYPSASPNVLSVGGTSVYPNGMSYGAELAWNLPQPLSHPGPSVFRTGSGGGISPFEGQPTYQFGTQSTGRRTTPDVAWAADGYTFFPVYINDPLVGATGWHVGGGTSLSAPMWAGLVAIVNQGRVAAGKAPLANIQQYVYQLPSSSFHDIEFGEEGSTTFLAPYEGYDLYTGLGSPIADRVVRDLIAISGNPLAGVSTNPLTPAVTAKAATGPGIYLQWSLSPALLTPPVQYDIYRFDGSVYQKINTVSTSSIFGAGFTPSFLDTGLPGGKYYQYAVKAITATGTNADGFVDFFLPKTANSLSLAKAVATANGATQVNLAWGNETFASPATITGFDVYKYDGASYKVIKSLSPSGMPYLFTDTGLTANAVYQYAVRAKYGGGGFADSFADVQTPFGASPPSIPITPPVTTTTSSTALPVVQNAITVATAGSNKVNLSWNASSFADPGTIVRYDLLKYDGAKYSVIKSLTAGSSAQGYSDAGVAAGGFYQYAVRAVHSSGAYQDSFADAATPAPTASSAKLAAVDATFSGLTAKKIKT